MRSSLLVVAALAVASTLVVGVVTHHPSGTTATYSPPPASAEALPGAKPHGPVGEADGVVPAGTTVFNHDLPAMTKLRPSLVRALRAAATDALDDRVVFFLDSGWRSRAYQQQLFGEAVEKYGSAAAAEHWVARPGRSSHELGEAVDIGHADADDWLSHHGSRYGLCQIYRNEPWHFELRPAAVDDGCPPMYADPTHDPRLTGQAAS